MSRRASLVFTGRGTGYAESGAVRIVLARPMFVPGLEAYDEIDFRPRPFRFIACLVRRGRRIELSEAEQHAVMTKLRRIESAAMHEVERRQLFDRRQVQLPWTGPERRQGERRGG